MTLDDSIQRISKRYYQMGGTLAGQRPYQIYNQNVSGTSVLYTPTVSRKYRSEPGTKDAPRPQLAGVTYYSIYGKRARLLPGRLLLPSTGTPALQVLTVDDLEVIVGFKVDRIGGFYRNTSAYLTNVRYSWLDSQQASGVEQMLLSGQVDKPTRQLVCWAHDLLKPHNTLLQGLLFKETDGTLQRRWVVSNFEWNDPLMVFTVKEQ